MESKSDDAEDAYCCDMAVMSQWGGLRHGENLIRNDAKHVESGCPAGFLWADDMGRCGKMFSALTVNTVNSTLLQDIALVNCIMLA